MEVSINGETRTLVDGTTVETVVSSECIVARGVAVACNGEVVPRSEWGHTVVHAGDELEVLGVAAGG